MHATALAALLLALTLPACAGPAPQVAAPAVEARAFRLDALRADALILAVLRENWPDKTPEPLGADAIGYSITVHWASASDRVHAQALREADGRWSFRVWSDGTAPEAGIPARERLAAALEAAAQRAQDPASP